MPQRTLLLFLNVLVIATCGLVYELLAGTLASYVLGDSVTQFSLIIGVYLFALGVGAWLSQFIHTDLPRRFVEVELGVALLGGLSAPLLFLSFATLTWFHIVLYGLVFAIGTLVGLELPLLMRLLETSLDFRDLVSRVLAFDYVGALVASVLFPMFFVPRLGLVRTSLVFGLLNAAVGLWGTWLLRPMITGSVLGLRIRAVGTIVLLTICLIKADSLTNLAEDQLFSDPIVFAKQTPYQRIIVTNNRAGFQLFLNGNLQFSSVDEYRYHEALVHPAAVVRGSPKNVMVLGGGDGLAVRELLKWPSIESITLVDIDAGMTSLASDFAPLDQLNAAALSDPRVTIVNTDAMLWLETAAATSFDLAIIDFPDPNSFALGKLYTTRFYRLLKSRLTADAAIAVQCTSPLFARRSFWCVIRTMESAGLHVRPYQLAVPSFGVWGYALAAARPWEVPTKLPGGLPLRFLNDESLAALFTIPVDIGPVDVEVNRLDNQALVRYYESEWHRFE